MAGLRELAEADMAQIMEGNRGSDSWPITVTDPDGNSATLQGFSTDIHLSVDPETGQMVSGRQASIALRIGNLTANGLGLPVAVSRRSRKPWLVSFDDIGGSPWTFKVMESAPDRMMGMVTCMLEVYENG